MNFAKFLRTSLQKTSGRLLLSYLLCVLQVIIQDVCLSDTYNDLRLGDKTTATVTQKK